MVNLNHSGIDAKDAAIFLPSLPSGDMSPTTTAQRRPVMTELVIIQSSIPKGVGPHPRVLKRKNSLYMLPRSPKSPTLHRDTTAVAQLSRRKDYAPASGKRTKVA